MTSLRRRMTEDTQGEESFIAYPSHVRATGLAVCTSFNKSPEILSPEEIRSYQIYLTNERKLAPSSIIIAVAALRFLYKITLHKNWNFEEVIPSPKKPQKLPIVLSPEYQASHDPYDLLRCRTARLGGGLLEGHGYRQ